MRAVLKAYEVKDRKVWVADSFEGLPPPNTDKYPADKGDIHHQLTHLAISLEEVKENFSKYGLLDEQVCFLKGWFKDALPTAPIEKLAVMRLDGDMYESTMDALKHLYPKLSVGGYVIIDDYGYIHSCRQAVHDFREANQIRDEIKLIDWSGVYWKRSQ
jgi:O-methyltransferase